MKGPDTVLRRRSGLTAKVRYVEKRIIGNTVVYKATVIWGAHQS